MVRAEGDDPPPLTVNLTVKRPFFTTPLIETLFQALIYNSAAREIPGFHVNGLIRSIHC